MAETTLVPAEGHGQYNLPMNGHDDKGVMGVAPPPSASYGHTQQGLQGVGTGTAGTGTVGAGRADGMQAKKTTGRQRCYIHKSHNSNTLYELPNDIYQHI